MFLAWLSNHLIELISNPQLLIPFFRIVLAKAQKARWPYPWSWWSWRLAGKPFVLYSFTCAHEVSSFVTWLSLCQLSRILFEQVREQLHLAQMTSVSRHWTIEDPWCVSCVWLCVDAFVCLLVHWVTGLMDFWVTRYLNCLDFWFAVCACVYRGA